MPLSQRGQKEEAAKLYEEFTGHDALHEEKFTDPGEPKKVVAAKFGKLDFLVVKTHDGKKIEIVFEGRNRPDLAASHDGKRLHIFGGPVPKVTGKKRANGIDAGTITGIAYSTTRDGKREKYLHDFRPASRPTLFISAGKMRIVGGAFRFKDSGINDI